MRILVTGGNGQIASALSKIDIDNEMLMLSKRECDITQSDVLKLVCSEYKPHLILNCAAFTAVDKAEEEKAEAFDINAFGAEVVAQQCAELNIPLLHLSTDYVFSGENPEGYSELDEPHPLNFYGESKLKGEISCQRFCPHSIILRTSAVFGHQGHNFVKSILNAAKEKEILEVVNDQFTCPTSADAIAKTCYQIVNHIHNADHFSDYGIYHYANLEKTSWFDFAKLIVEEAKAFCDLKTIEVKPISSEQSGRKAKRPQYAILKCDRLHETFGISQTSFKPYLSALIKDLLA